MSNFWQQLKKPVFALAPMEEVTDFAFREMFARYSGPRGRGEPSAAEGSPRNGFVLFTEFVNVDGLTHPEGRKKLAIDLKYSEAQRPIVAQLWGVNPEKFTQAAQIIAELGFDGVDINMGCPQSKEIAIGACAALIRQPQLAGEIIEAVKKGAGNLPVSVKTRIGYSKPEEMEEWVKTILEFEPAALTIHARTKKEMSKVAAHWDKITEAVQIRDRLKSQALILGNGDIKSRCEGLDRIKETGADGVMIGRGAFGNPWLFCEDHGQPDAKERLSAMLEHAELFNKELGGMKSFALMRKHFKAYVSGFDGAHELRAQLMQTKTLAETREIVSNFIQFYRMYKI